MTTPSPDPKPLTAEECAEMERQIAALDAQPNVAAAETWGAKLAPHQVRRAIATIAALRGEIAERDAKLAELTDAILSLERAAFTHFSDSTAANGEKFVGCKACGYAWSTGQAGAPLHRADCVVAKAVSLVRGQGGVLK